LPAVVSVPPFHGATWSWRQTSFCWIGSQAISRPKGLLVGGWALICMPVFQPLPLIGWPGTLEPNFFQVLSSASVTGTFCAGM